MSTPAALSRDALIEQHVPVVERLVNCMWKRWPIAGMERADLVSYGTIGLIRAADTFDESRGAEFPTHAYNCIRRALQDVYKSAAVRISSRFVTEALDEEQLSTDDTTSASDNRLDIEAALAQLSPQLRTAMDLHYVRGHNKTLVARSMGISPTHAGRLIKKGLAQLRELLSQ